MVDIYKYRQMVAFVDRVVSTRRSLSRTRNTVERCITGRPRRRYCYIIILYIFFSHRRVSHKRQSHTTIYAFNTTFVQRPHYAACEKSANNVTRIIRIRDFNNIMLYSTLFYTRVLPGAIVFTGLQNNERRRVIINQTDRRVQKSPLCTCVVCSMYRRRRITLDTD